MEGRDRNVFGKLYILMVLEPVAIGLKLILAACRDSIVIEYGIHLYRVLNTVSIVAVAVCTAALAAAGILLAYRIISSKKAKSEEAEKESDARREAGERKAVLSVRKEMDSAKLYNILTEYASKSNAASEGLLKCALQLKTMDVYQEKLSRLLENNGVTSLSDTQEVLDKVEQYLCKEVRKVINLINVSDEESIEDAERINAQLRQCYKECQVQLDQVKDFLFTMAEFLNRQGSDDTTPETLEMYKKCILESIEKE